jgi:hypothetical protein
MQPPHKEIHMSKKEIVASATKEIAGIRRAATMAGRAMARLEGEAERIAAATGATGRSLRLVLSKDQLSALIRCGGTTIQIEGDDFAVSLNGKEGAE